MSAAVALVELLPEAIQQQGTAKEKLAAQVARSLVVPVAASQRRRCNAHGGGFVAASLQYRGKQGNCIRPGAKGTRVVRERILAEPELF